MDGMTIPHAVQQRALDHTTWSGACLLSKYSVGSHGYPQIGWFDRDKGKNVMRLVHRVAWEIANGPIPENMTVDHIRSICVGPPCVNSEHLRLLTNFENARRTRGRDWPLGFCIAGHPNDRLVRVGGTGKWICRDCRTEYHRRYNERKKAGLV